MDPINIIAGLNLFATFAANLGGARKGFKSSISASREKPRTYLQKLPLFLSMLTLIGLILAIFQVGTLTYKGDLNTLRTAALAVYIFFSWVQIWAYKSLGSSYSQDVLIMKNHSLVRRGPFKFIRHPQYLSQILLDLGAGLATLSYIIIPLVIVEIPFLIMRAGLEEKLLAKYFKDDFQKYKKNTGFMLPFIG